MVIFLKILYTIAIIWNTIRAIVYMIFAAGVDPEEDMNGIEIRVDLMWSMLHVMCVAALFSAWKVIF